MMRSKVFSIILLGLLSNALFAQKQAGNKQNRDTCKTNVNDTSNMPGFRLRQKQSDIDDSHLKPVENLGIFEGKKTELIIPENLTANLATNNSRQVFSRVAGLNIWDNDGAGLQLNIGGRGLDPNRSSNFNVRQNGYDISADALGYPESYYTPPLEAVSKIQIVRGAASLQFGTQFGGLVNFVMKKGPKDKKLELQMRQSFGSFGFYNAFTSVGGSIKKFSYYGFYQYKEMQGWRSNSRLNASTLYTSFNYNIGANTDISLDYTLMNYLAQQPGGLTDAMFKDNPEQTNRSRNWFDVNWNLFALHFKHEFSKRSEFNFKVFGLLAHRYAIGFRPNRVATTDNNSERDLLKGEFQNTGIEARYLNRIRIKEKTIILLAGTRIYRGNNTSIQGLGSKNSDADFQFVNTDNGILNNYSFPNENLSVFSEAIIPICKNLTVTPGLRFEHIQTRARGYYNSIQYDLAGNIIQSTRYNENRKDLRQFMIGGMGISYKPGIKYELYGNITQNFRSITFNDMRITNPSQVIDPDLKDERGYSMDIGLRNTGENLVTIDVSAFYLSYMNRIGEVQFYDASNRVMRLRSNIGKAAMSGIESYIETDLFKLIKTGRKNLSAAVFVNMAYIHSAYKTGLLPGIEGNKVEFVPDLNLKSGLRFGSKNFKATIQATYLSEQFTDASNARDGGISAVVGIIPAYYVLDASLSYQFHRFKLELSSNNFTNNLYFTRRATGYPGPGIIPADARSFFLSLGFRI